MQSGDSSYSSLYIRLFGTLQVTVNGQLITDFRTRKEKWLLALLVLARGRPVARTMLAQTLWPYPETLESRANLNLRRSLMELRKTLGNEARRLQSPDRRHINLDLSHADVDLLAFHAAIGEGSYSSLHRAISLYQGPLLYDCTESWILSDREANQQAYQQALMRLAIHARTQGNSAEAIDYLRKAVAVDPLEEEPQRSLMEALARNKEHHAALQVYQDLCRRLQAMDPRALPSEETSHVNHQIRTEARRRAATPSAIQQIVPALASPAHLPRYLTELIGREEEISEVATRLRRCRLVTLTGTGGIGKTRLAVGVADALRAEYADGVWFTDLSPLQDGQLIAQTLASTFGLQGQPGIAPDQCVQDYLAAKCLLLVLDNCEHLVEACARLVQELLVRCAELRVLTTSRQPLGLAGEAVWQVPFMAVPEEALLQLEGRTLSRVLPAYEGVQLFLDRAQEKAPSFRLTADNAQTVARICMHLDGIPLALELAAAQIGSLSLEAIAAGLNDRLGLLQGGYRARLPRHNALTDLLAWSRALLSPPEQALFRRLSVFADGWNEEAAVQVCADTDLPSGDIRALLHNLAEKSLIMRDLSRISNGAERQAPHPHRTQTRYRFLETTHDYAREQLKRAGEASKHRGRHLACFLDLAETAYGKESSPDRSIWFDRLYVEESNLRVALNGALQDRCVEQSIALAGALWSYWRTRGQYAEGRKWLAATLALAPESDADSLGASLARAWYGAGILALSQGDLASGRHALQQCCTLFRKQGNNLLLVRTLTFLGTSAVLHCQDFEEGAAWTREALQIGRAAGEPMAIAAALSGCSFVAREQGDYDLARSLVEETIPLLNALPLADTLNNLGYIVFLQGDIVHARYLHEQSLNLYAETKPGFIMGTAWALLNLSRVYRAERNYAEASTRLSASLRLFESTGDQIGIASVLLECAVQEAAQQRFLNAIRLLACMKTLRDALCFPLQHGEQADYHGILRDARNILAEREFDAAWQGASSMPPVRLLAEIQRED